MPSFVTRRLRKGGLLLASVAVTLGHATVASAEGSEAQLAQALFEEGRLLMDAARFEQACAKFAESQRLDPAGGTLLNLALCHERERKLAKARADFENALALAIRDGRSDRATLAREHIANLEGRVPRVAVSVPAASEFEGLEVTVDGLALRRAAWGAFMPVDPGEHVIEAKAPARAAWSTVLRLDAGEKKSVSVPLLALLPSLPEVPAVALEPPSSVLPSSVPAEAVRDSQPSTTGGANPLYYAAIILTVGSAATSAVMSVMAWPANQDAKVGCVAERHYCRDEASARAADRAGTLAWVSTVTLGGALVGFVSMLLIPPRKSSPRASIRAGVLSVEAAF
jgi:hypothetical protein